LDCGYKWTVRKLILNFGYRRCPNPYCRSYRAVPITFPEMVEVAIKLGINDNTPFRDMFNAFRSVRGSESILDLGYAEFRKIMNLVIEEAEKRKRNPQTKRGEL